MNKALVSLLALIALSGHAMAGASVHATASLPTGESHTVDIIVNDDGTYSILLDGAPVDPAALPGLPGIPAPPAAPGAPGVPALPGAPGVPGAPGIPALPIPTLP